VYRHSHENLHIVVELVTHIVAFVVLENVEEEQHHMAHDMIHQAHHDHTDVTLSLDVLYLGTPFVVLFAFFVMRRVAAYLRERYKEQEEWCSLHHEIREMEADASAIVFGMACFIAFQYLLKFRALGDSVPGNCEKDIATCPIQALELEITAATIAVFALLICISTYFLDREDSSPRLREVHEIVQAHLVMTMSWLLRGFFGWCMAYLAAHHKHILARLLSISCRKIVGCYLLIPFCLCLLIALDYLSSVGRLSRRMVTPFNNALGLLVALQIEGTYEATFGIILQRTKTMGEDWLASGDPIERSDLGPKLVMMQVLLCGVVAGFISPAWKWYIVPRIVHHEHHHDEHANEVPRKSRLTSRKQERIDFFEEIPNAGNGTFHDS